MKSQKLLRVAAVTVLGLSLGAGVASAAPGDGSIENTGPDSHNWVSFDSDMDVDVDNDTDVDVDNDTDQDADSGDAKVHDNTTGGDATSGDAMNDNSTSVHASVNNSGASAAALGGGGGGSWSGSIDTTGPDSWNKIDFDSDVDIDVDNDTDIDVDNDTDQDARSGDASVYHNTTGGSATTGNAVNTNSTEVVIEVTN